MQRGGRSRRIPLLLFKVVLVFILFRDIDLIAEIVFIIGIRILLFRLGFFLFSENDKSELVSFVF